MGGVAVVDILGGHAFAQGYLATLYQRGDEWRRGGVVQVSMFESILHFQFEAHLFYNDGNQLACKQCCKQWAYVLRRRMEYKTKNNYLALAMGNIILLS